MALCRLLLQQPDILLLDEPTNHLDAESIDWLEQHLQQYPGTVIAITHDLNPEKRNEPSCKNEVVQNLQKRSVQKSTSAQYKKSTEKTYFFGAFLLLCLLAISPKITNFKQ